MAFDAQAAKQAGYSDAEITSFLAQQNPKFDVKGAKDAGYSDQEIANHLSGGGKQTEVRPAPLSFIEQATSNVSPINDPSKMAGIGTQAVASLPTNVKERASYFAKQRFPNDPNGVARYGVQDGRLFYTGEDGQMYYEEPKLSASPTELVKYAASGAGPSLPIAGSIAGGVATAPAGGIPGAGLGAAAGDEMRQLMAMALAGQKDFSPMQSVKEGAMGAGGQAIGIGAGKALNRNAVRDVAKTQTPEAQAMINELMGKSKQEGIQLTPAELTNLKSLKGQQNFLGDSPRSADTMGDFYTKRNTEQVPQAVNKMLGKISPIESTEVGAQNLQRGAAEAIDFAKGERMAASTDLYKEVFPKKIPPSHFQKLAGTNNIIRNAINGANKDEVTMYYVSKYQQETGKEISKNSVGFLDAVKQSLDGKAKAAAASGNNKAAKAYSDSAEQLRTQIDSMVPKYGEARAAYAGESPAVDALTKGEVGLAAGKKPTQLDTIPSTIFETGPNAVKTNRAAYVKAGKEQEWNDGLRSHLQSKFDQASKEFKTGNTNPGASFRAKVFGTDKQKAAMQNAMSPDQWAGFNRLMDVLEASGRVTQGGSRTYFAGEQGREMASQAMGLSGKAAQNALDIPGIPRRLGNFVQDVKLGKHSEKLAEIVTSPDAMKQLKQLKALNPRSVKAMGIVFQLLTQYGISEVSQPAASPAGNFSNP